MKKWIVMIALFLTATLGMFGYLRGFTTTEEDNLWLGVTPESAAGWELTALQNGEEVSITPEEAINPTGTVLLRRVVTEDWLTYETIAVDGHRPVCIWVEETPVFSNCPVSLEAVGELGQLTMPEGQPFDMVFSMNPSWVGKTMTLATSLFTSEPFGSIGFSLRSTAAQQAQTSAWVTGRAFPGIAFGVLSLLLFGLFLFRSTVGKGALPLLYLTAAALVQMLSSLDGIDGNPLVLSYISVIRALCVLLPMLYLSTKMDWQRKLFGRTSVLLWSIYFASVLAWEVFYLPVPEWFTKLSILTLPLLLLLLWCAVREWRAGNAYFGRFLILSGAATVWYGVLFCVGVLFHRSLLDWLLGFWREALAGYPMPMIYSICSVILVMLFLLAVWDLVESSVRTAKEIETLKLRSELTAQSLSSVQAANETLATVRHDELHHLRTLAALYREDTAQGAEYAASLTQELENIPSMRFTENRLANAILSVQSAACAAADVRFEAKAKLPETLAIPETELSMVLMNLLENALEAAAKAPEVGGRRVSALLEVEDNTLLVTISNSLPLGFDQEVFRNQIFPTTKGDTARHGYGISSARAIVSRRGGELRYSVKDSVLTVNTAMELGMA